MTQISRSAFVIGIRAASLEGSKPPINPSTSEKISAEINRSGVMRKLKASSQR
jgi:hypothetical protein